MEDRKILIEKDGIDLVNFAGYTYFIEWERLDSKDSIIHWIMHFSDKKWCDVKLIAQLIYVACEHHKMEIYCNA